MRNKFATLLLFFGVFIVFDRFAINGYFGASRHVLNVISNLWSGCLSSKEVGDKTIIAVCMGCVIWGIWLFAKSMKEELIEKIHLAEQKKKQKKYENYYEEIIPEIDNAEEVIEQNYTASGKVKTSAVDSLNRLKDYEETVERRKAYRKARRDRTNFNGKRWF